MEGIKVSVIHDDAFRVKADTLILKFAQAGYGLDEIEAFEAQVAGIIDSIDKRRKGFEV